jgi:transcriptional regulator with XRE-family HTH domain
MVDLSHPTTELRERKGAAVRPVGEHERYRRLRGHSITSLAAAIGRSRLWVSRIENGHETPSAKYRRDVAKALAVPEELIFPPEKRVPGLAGQQGTREDTNDAKTNAA